MSYNKNGSKKSTQKIEGPLRRCLCTAPIIRCYTSAGKDEIFSHLCSVINNFNMQITCKFFNTNSLKE